MIWYVPVNAVRLLPAAAVPVTSSPSIVASATIVKTRFFIDALSFLVREKLAAQEMDASHHLLSKAASKAPTVNLAVEELISPQGALV